MREIGVAAAVFLCVLGGLQLIREAVSEAKEAWGIYKEKRNISVKIFLAVALFFFSLGPFGIAAIILMVYLGYA